MILDKIVESTKIRVRAAYQRESFESIKTRALNFQSGKVPFAFEQALKKQPIAFICEVKKASPSKGLIAKEFDYIEIAKEYEKSGAACISVLTEPEFFRGSLSYLKEISENVKIPLLRKDFIIHEYQIYEAKLSGADAILLICSILCDEQMVSYIKIADKLGMSEVVEAHDEDEVRRAKRCGARIIGVNNRNLKDFTVDINNSLRYRDMVADDTMFISESGIQTPDDIKTLVDHKVNAVLIGETLMRAENKQEMIKHLLSKSV